MESQNEFHQIYIQEQLQEQFIIHPIFEGKSCNVPRNLIRINNNTTQKHQQVLTIHNHDDKVYQILVEQSNYKNKSIITTQFTNENSTLLSNQSIKFFLQQSCTEYSIQNRENVWDFIYVNVTLKDDLDKNHTIPFQFTYSCNQNQGNVTFDWSLIILVSISVILMGFLMRFSRITSFTYKAQNGRFQGFKIDIKIMCFYFIMYSIGYFLVFNLNYVEQLGIAVKYSIYVIGFSCSLFIIDEILCLSINGSFWKRRIFYKIRLCEFFSFLLASGVMSLYLLTQAWYMSNLISIFIMSTIAKLFKFKNLKNAFYFLIICILLDGTGAGIIQFVRKESYNSLTLRVLNCPIELQLPLIELQYDRSCAWISLFSVAVPGLFLGFTYRFDKNKRTFSYTVFTGLSLIIGYIIWIATTIFYTYSIPSSLVIYPSILIGTLLVALKRNELQSIWEAEFFDEFLEKTYRLSNMQGEIDNANKFNLLDGIDEYPDEQRSQSRILK